jgi:hypothetical protein
MEIMGKEDDNVKTATQKTSDLKLGDGWLLQPIAEPQMSITDITDIAARLWRSSSKVHHC